MEAGEVKETGLSQSLTQAFRCQRQSITTPPIVGVSADKSYSRANDFFEREHKDKRKIILQL